MGGDRLAPLEAALDLESLYLFTTESLLCSSASLPQRGTPSFVYSAREGLSESALFPGLPEAVCFELLAFLPRSFPAGWTAHSNYPLLS